MSKTTRRVSRFLRLQNKAADNTARGVAPIAMIVAGTAEDGRLQGIVDGRDCVTTGTIESAAPGDAVDFPKRARVEGPAAAPPAGFFGSGPGLPPQIESVDPDIWTRGLVQTITANGFNLDNVAALELRRNAPYTDMTLPDVTVNSLDLVSATEMTFEVDVDPGIDLELRGSIAVDEKDTPPARRLAVDLYGFGDVEITAINAPIWWEGDNVLTGGGTGQTVQVILTGTGLGSIDTVFFDHPVYTFPSVSYFESVTVTNATATQLTVDVVLGDNFSESEPDLFGQFGRSGRPFVAIPQTVQFGVGGLQFVSGALWQAFPPVLPVESWHVSLFDIPAPFTLAGPGIYANQAYDPETAVLLPGRFWSVPGLSDTYSPPNAAYLGRLDVQTLANDPTGQLDGQIAVISNRGDAVPDGGADTARDYGPGSGPWVAVVELDTGTVRKTAFGAENRLLGPVVDAAGIWAVIYEQAAGAQVVRINTNGGFATFGPRRVGSPPLEMLAGDAGSLVCSVWDTGSIFYSQVAVFGKAGTWSIGTFSTPCIQNREWFNNARGSVAVFVLGGRHRIGQSGGTDLRSLTGTYGTVTTETDQWPNATGSGRPQLQGEAFQADGTIGAWPSLVVNGEVFIYGGKGFAREHAAHSYDQESLATSIPFSQDIDGRQGVQCILPARALSEVG